MDYTNTKDFLNYYSKVRKRTLALVKLIDERNIDFSFKPDQFSVGDLARHIALVESEFYQPILMDKKPSYEGCNSVFAQNKDEVIKLYEKASSGMIQILESTPASFLSGKCKFSEGLISRWKWLLLALEHEIHHRGQLYYLLRSQGTKTPHIFGLSSEDLIDMSEKNSS